MVGSGTSSTRMSRSPWNRVAFMPSSQADGRAAILRTGARDGPGGPRPDDGRLAPMADYDYRCEQHGVFELTFPIAKAPETAACPECGAEAPRSFGAPLTTA